MDRAKQRSLHCTELGDYRKGIDVWDWKDMDMKDPSTTTVPAQNQPGRQVPKQESKNEDGGNVPVIAPPMVPQSDLNAPTRAQQLLQPSVTARPQYDWYGRAKAERLWQPRVEGSIPANDNFLGGKTQIFSRRPRGPMIRVTPGMGFGGGVGGGGGKPRFLPRFPGDSVSGKPTVIY
jgi:hypothetical protein